MNKMAIETADLDVCRLSGGAVPAMIALQNTVCARLYDAALYFPLTDAEMIEMVGPGAISVGAYHHDRLVGFFGVLYMGQREDNLGIYLGIPDDELPLVTYFKATNVEPDYRGRGLQQIMTHALFSAMGVACSPLLRYSAVMPIAPTPDRPTPSWLTSTVAPQNLASLASFFNCGFWIADLKPKYHGHMRYLMLRKHEAVKQPMGGAVAVPLSDYQTQVGLLAHGWRGVRLLPSADHSQILYIRTQGQ